MSSDQGPGSLLSDDDGPSNVLATSAARHGVPGAVVGLLTPQGTRRWSSGVLGLRTQVPTTVDSIFKIGSITKLYTATLVALLAQQGSIDLDRPVVGLLPGLPLQDDVRRQVTPRHLLTHTSGIDGDLYLDTGRGDDALASYVDQLGLVSQLHRPGETLSYCNAGFNLAGHLVAEMVGTSWECALRELLLEPAGLSETVTFPEEALLHRVAVGHVPGPGGLRQTTTWSVPRASAPSATLAATVSDLLRFAQLHLGASEGAAQGFSLPAAVVKEMRRAHAPVPALGMGVESWGLGWWRATWDGSPVLAHDGSSSGQRAYLRLFPGHGVAVAVLTNGGDGAALAQAVHDDLVPAVCSVRVPGRFAPEPPVEGSWSWSDDVVGTYRRDSEITQVSDVAGVLEMTVRWVGALLDGEDEDEAPERFSLSPVSPGLMAARAWKDGQGPTTIGPAEPVTFYRLSDGRPVLHFRMRANPGVAGPAEARR